MWLSPQFPADLVTFTEEILNGKLYFLYSAPPDMNIDNTLYITQGITVEGSLQLRGIFRTLPHIHEGPFWNNNQQIITSIIWVLQGPK